MRFRFLLLSISFLICCGIPNNPKDVAGHFIDASLRMDFKEAKKYATPEAVKMLDFVQNIAAKTSRDSSLLKDVKVEIEEAAITGDHATVKYKKQGSKDEYYISLERIDGKWLVSSGISDLKEGSEAQAGEKVVPADSTVIN